MTFARQLVAAAALFAIAGASAAHAQSFFRIGTGSAGGTYYPLGGIVATAIGALMMGSAGDLVGLRLPVGVGAVVALAMLGVVALRADRIRAAIEGPATP